MLLRVTYTYPDDMPIGLREERGGLLAAYIARYHRKQQDLSDLLSNSECSERGSVSSIKVSDGAIDYESNALGSICAEEATAENVAISMVWFHSEMLTIGRLQYNDVIIPVPSISSVHARVYRHGRQLYIEDLDSRNGTYLNGFAIQRGELVVIRPGDHLQLANLLIKLQLLATVRRSRHNAKIMSKIKAISEEGWVDA